MFPIFCVLIGGVMLLVSRYAKISDNYNKYMLMTGVIIEAIFLTLNVVFVIYSLSYVEEAEPFDISKVMMIIFGLLFIVLGNYMPKIEKNRTLGLKTYWSMYNEVTWQKTHRFTGFSSFIAGVLILISGILFKETVNFIILMSILLVFITSCTVASYVYYRQEKIKE
jgi:uncharacterized membrane protein